MPSELVGRSRAGVSHALDRDVQRAARQAHVEPIAHVAAGGVHDDAAVGAAHDGVAALERGVGVERAEAGAADRVSAGSCLRGACPEQGRSAGPPERASERPVGGEPGPHGARGPVEQEADALTLGGEVGAGTERSRGSAARRRGSPGRQRGGGRPRRRGGPGRPRGGAAARRGRARPARPPPTASRRARRRRTPRASRPSRGRHPRRPGAGCAAMARTTGSSLKAQRSSSEPPPRATMTTSTARPVAGSVQRPMRRSARTMDSAAPGPWTWQALTTMRASGQRRAMTRRMSWRTAPDSEVHDADAARPGRQRPLAGGVEEALRGEPRLERLEPQRQVADAGRLEAVDVELVGALRLEDVDAGRGRRCGCRSAARAGMTMRSSRKIMQRSWARSSLSVK